MTQRGISQDETGDSRILNFYSRRNDNTAQRFEHSAQHARKFLVAQLSAAIADARLGASRHRFDDDPARRAELHDFAGFADYLAAELADFGDTAIDAFYLDAEVVDGGLLVFIAADFIDRDMHGAIGEIAHGLP